MTDIIQFVRESNRIEGIMRAPTDAEIQAHLALLASDDLDVNDIEAFVADAAPGKPLRRKPHMNVRVGNHVAPQGGDYIVKELDSILIDARETIIHPYFLHQRYEFLHPFMDGNGRSGRALWLWSMDRFGKRDQALSLGFLHNWYYQSLANADIRRNG